MHIVLHISPTLVHQHEHSEWFTEGLKRHGLNLDITTDPHKEGDVHIVSGPHYAKRYWLDHPKTLLIDRAYHPNKQIKSGQWVSEDYVSVGWMNKDGGRDFRKTESRGSYSIQHQAGDKGTIFLKDYGGPEAMADTVRLHPAEKQYPESLEDALKRHKTAIGFRTTALVKAGLMGLDIVCLDKQNIMAQPDWLELLPSADWHYSEIQSGEAWEFLCQ